MLTLELESTLIVLSITVAVRVLTEVRAGVMEASAAALTSHRWSSTEARSPDGLGVTLTFIGVLS
eukprot:3763361-Lingulodinium_polyedra.AAC.1